MNFKLEKAALYIALLVAWVAMLGSLYFSNVMHYEPCEWCWRQRIIMYPMTLLISIAILRRSEEVAYYTLGFSLLGIGASTYHYLLQKTTLFDEPGAVCGFGPPCKNDPLNWFGFLTIPFLALIAFLLIFFCTIILLTSKEAIWDEAEPTHRLIPTLSILAIVILPFALAQLPTAPHSGNSATVTTPTIRDGTSLYSTNCAYCHGIDGKGNAGPALIGGDFIRKSDSEWIAYVKKGCAPGEACNRLGGVMPPNGNNPTLTESDLQAILNYLRSQ